MNVPVFCFGRQVLWMICLIRLRLLMSLFLAAIFWQHKGIGGLLSKGFSHSQSEILDAADITLRYDWACVEARVHGKEAPASLNGDVVMERHYAFNWIIGANGGAGWDDIQPNT